MNTKIKVVISGSFRKHLDNIGIALINFTRSNIEVLAPITKETVKDNSKFVFLVTDNPEKSAYILEKDFMSNIRKADFLYVTDIDGYVGHSVATEMAFAIVNNIPIVVAEEINNISDEIPDAVKKLLKKASFRKLSIRDINQERILELNITNFITIDLTNNEITLLQSSVEKLLEELKSVNI